MITKRDLLEAIAECQGTRSPNANTAIKLAAFYTILDHLEEEERRPAEQAVDQNSFTGYSLASPGTVRFNGQSEFAKAVNGRDQEDIWPIIDELMTLVKSMNERLYNGVMRKLQ